MESALLKAQLDKYVEIEVKLIDLIHPLFFFCLEMVIKFTFHYVLIPLLSQRTTISF